MLRKNSKLYKSIPPAIRPFVAQCNILASEDPKEYFDLLGALVDHFKPKSTMEWLNVKKMQDLLWEQFRLSRIKPGVIDSVQKQAVVSLLASLPVELQHLLKEPFGAFFANDLAGRWFFDNKVKKLIEAVFQKLDYSQDTIDAVAFVRRAKHLTTLESMQMSNEARQVVVRRQLEEEREVLELNSSASTENSEKARQLPPPADNDDNKTADDDTAQAENEQTEAKRAGGEEGTERAEAEHSADEEEGENTGAEQAEGDDEDGEHAKADEAAADEEDAA